MNLNNIKQLCDEKGVTLAQMERDLNLSKGMVYKWHDCEPSLKTVRLMADYFGRSVDAILAVLS